MKSFVITCLVAIASLTGLFLGIANAAPIFSSGQVGTNPVSGYYLKTNGITSTWAAVSGGSGSSTVLYAGNGITLTPNPINVSGTVAVNTSTIQSLFSAGGTGLTYSTTSGQFTWTNPGYITTSTYNASITIATAAPLTGGGALTNNTTLSLSCPTCYTTSNLTFPLAYGSSTHTTFTTTTASGVFNFLSSGGNATLTIPSNLGFFTNDKSYATTGQLSAYQLALSFPLAYGSTTHLGAGTGISISSQNINNTGVLSFNGATGTVTYAPSTTIPTTYIKTIDGSTGATDYTVNAGTNITLSTTSNSLTINSSASGGGAATSSFSFTIEYPFANENDNPFIAVTTSTITGCDAVNKSGGDTVTWGLGFASSRASATSSLSYIVQATSTTATTTPQAMTISSTTIPKGYPVIFYTTAASSTGFTFTCNYTPS